MRILKVAPLLYIAIACAVVCRSDGHDESERHGSDFQYNKNSAHSAKFLGTERAAFGVALF